MNPNNTQTANTATTRPTPVYERDVLKASNERVSALEGRRPRPLPGHEAMSAGELADFVTHDDTDTTIVRATAPRTWANHGKWKAALLAYISDRGPQLGRDQKRLTGEASERIARQREVFNKHHRLLTEVSVEAMTQCLMTDVSTGVYTAPSARAVHQMVLGWFSEYKDGRMPVLPGKGNQWKGGAKRLLNTLIRAYEEQHGVKLAAPTAHASTATLTRSVYGVGMGTVEVQPQTTSDDPLAWADAPDPILAAQQVSALKHFDVREVLKGEGKGDHIGTAREEERESDYAVGAETLERAFKALKLVGLGPDHLNAYSSADLEGQARELRDEALPLHAEMEEIKLRLEELASRKDLLLAQTEAQKARREAASAAQSPEERSALWDDFANHKSSTEEAWSEIKSISGTERQLRAELRQKRDDLREFMNAMTSLEERAAAADTVGTAGFELTFAGEALGRISVVHGGGQKERYDEDSYIAFKNGRKDIYPRYINRRANAERRAAREAHAKATEAYEAEIARVTAEIAADYERGGMQSGSAKRIGERMARRQVRRPAALDDRLITYVVKVMAEERHTEQLSHAEQRVKHAQISKEERAAAASA